MGGQVLQSTNTPVRVDKSHVVQMANSIILIAVQVPVQHLCTYEYDRYAYGAFACGMFVAAEQTQDFHL